MGIVGGMIAVGGVGSTIRNLGQNAFGRVFVKYLDGDVPRDSTVIVVHIGEKSPAYVEENLRHFGANILRHECLNAKENKYRKGVIK